jgi:hypothetical protein
MITSQSERQQTTTEKINWAYIGQCTTAHKLNHKLRRKNNQFVLWLWCRWFVLWCCGCIFTGDKPSYVEWNIIIATIGSTIICYPEHNYRDTKILHLRKYKNNISVRFWVFRRIIFPALIPISPARLCVWRRGCKCNNNTEYNDTAIHSILTNALE